MDITIPLDMFEPKGQYAEHAWFRIRQEKFFAKFEEHLERTHDKPLPAYELNDVLENRPDVYYKALGMKPDDLDGHTAEEVGEAYCAKACAEFDSARLDGDRVRVTYRRGDASGVEALDAEAIRGLYGADGCECSDANEVVYTWKYDV